MKASGDFEGQVPDEASSDHAKAAIEDDNSAKGDFTDWVSVIKWKSSDFPVTRSFSGMSFFTCDQPGVYWIYICDKMGDVNRNQTYLMGGLIKIMSYGNKVRIKGHLEETVGCCYQKEYESMN